MALEKKGGYFNLGQLISIILCILPFIGWLCSFVTRIQKRDWLGAILTIFAGGFGLLWICDLLTLIIKNDIISLTHILFKK
ncbi:MAG: hypothetical protein Ta2E_06240 [Mycoplasmoidaceae bacterium]|nr:MAG: hypothetical protein Ta2E_06240 [Mycoplasmoidaceae bacterium]